MSLFEKIQWQSSDKALLASVRACMGAWSTKHQAVQKLRTRLLNLQNWRCVYCQVPIEADENGHREVEHVLPKSASKGCTKKKGTSNNEVDRRSTLGYMPFTYEPKNLAVCCKQCNTYKGSYDPLKDRSQVRPLTKYPGASGLLWLHPQLVRYSAHIDVDENFIFKGRTPGGRRVIRVCGLDRADVLERKFLARARTRARSMDSVKKTVEYLLASVAARAFGPDHAVASLMERYSVTMVEANNLFSLVSSANTAAKIEKANMACLAIEGRHNAKPLRKRK
ncbi:HNH endonuclease domain-containing protein [Ralstonia pseudosolanacearum]|uniref:HNH endonuclease n=1 Tax=Ralstonia pseudosolanacearum TaxID=1310165 RepID=UPI003CF70F05